MHIIKSYASSYAPRECLAIDLSSSENPLGCSNFVKQAIIEIDNFHYCPDKEDTRLLAKLATLYNNILVSAGANHFLENILHSFASRDNIVTSEVTFPESICRIIALGGHAILYHLKANLYLDLKGLLRITNRLCLFILANNSTVIWKGNQQQNSSYSMHVAIYQITLIKLPWAYRRATVYIRPSKRIKGE